MLNPKWSAHPALARWLGRLSASGRDRGALVGAILDSVEASIAVLDRDGTILAVNRSWSRFALDNGAEPGEPARGTGVGVNYLAACLDSEDLTDVADAAAARDGIGAVLAGCLPRFHMEYACHSPTRQRWFGLSATPLGAAQGGAVVAHEDISERVRAQEGLHQSMLRMTTFIRQSPISVAMFDRQMNYLANSDRWLVEYGRGHADLIGRNHYDVHPDVPEPWLRIHRLGLSGVATREDEDMWMQADGSRHWLRWAVVPWNDERGAVGGIIISAEDITARKEGEERIAHLGTHDALTDLPNLLLMKDRLAQAMDHARRNERQLALLLVDLDHFKFINDGYGHAFGDQLLRAAAARIASLLREVDTVARQGGDEFLVLLVDLRRRADAYIVAQKLLEGFRKPFALGGREVFLTASIGVSLFPQDGAEAAQLIGNADIAMYRAKAFGRDTYQFFTSQMSEESRMRVQLEGELRFALERKQLSLLYQPKVDLHSGRIAGCEALLRWHHPDLGAISPARFIPIAEETGMILAIGDWVLRSACEQNKAWQDAGLRPIVMSVNLSARQFRQSDVADWVRNALVEVDLDPHTVELELTESIIADDTDRVIEAVDELKRMGLKLSIDDFGTGFSSLTYLKRFHIDTLKIDQSFIRNMLTEPDDATIALAIIALAHGLRMSVIAEGVELAQQCAVLREHGCDAVQGYLFSRPVTAAQMAEMLRSDRRLT